MGSLLRRLTRRILRTDHLLRGWAVLWLLSLPFFHIHPETHPTHGEAGHVHAVSVHTLFSGDLDGEFGDPHQASPPPVGLATVPGVSAEGPPAWHTDPELSFSLLNDATDRKPIKPASTPWLMLSHHLPAEPAPHHPSYEDHWTPPAPTLFLVNLPTRAPPSSPMG